MQNKQSPPELQRILSLLAAHDKILIAAHVRPDGDAAGSSLAMGWILRAMGKEAVLYNYSGFPASLAWLELPYELRNNPDTLPFKPSLIVALDSGDRDRLGAALQPLLEKTPSINIDHHLGNTMFGTLANWVSPTASATGAMVARLAEAAGIPLTGSLAEAVYVAMVTDTGNFTYDNATPDSLLLCAALVENGLNVTETQARLDKTWTLNKARLWGHLFQNFQMLENDRLAVIKVSLELLNSLQAQYEDAEGFVEQLRKLRGVRVSLMLMEIVMSGKTMTKASFRSSGPDDVRVIAAQFGGGGHTNASGARIALNLEDSLQAILPRIRQIWSAWPPADKPCW